MKEATQASLRWDIERPNQLSIGFTLEAGPKDAEAEERMVQMIVEIPLGNIVLIPRGELHVGKVNLYVAVGDAKKRTAPVQEVPIQIEIPSREIETALQNLYRYKIDMRMRFGDQRISVGARDLFSAKSSFVSRNVTVGD
jgi:hypothetical protein